MLEIFSVTIPIFAIIALGYAGVRFGALGRSDMRPLSVFVMYFSIPAVVLMTLTERHVTSTVAPPFVAGYAIGGVIMFLVALVLVRTLRRLPIGQAGVYAMGMSMSNSVFIGYPVAVSAIGPDAAFFLIQCMLVENILMMPLAVAFIDRKPGADTRLGATLLELGRGFMRNPIIIAIAIGITMSLLAIPLPRPIAEAVGMLAGVAAPVALFVIGGSLAGLAVRGVLSEASLIVAGKLILFPLVMYAVFSLIPGATDQMRIAAVIFASVPMLSIYSIFGQRQGMEGLTAATLLVASAASFITITLLLWVVAKGVLTS